MLKKVFLVLEDGDVFEGEGVSQQAHFPAKAGEVVFNTSHSGYEEIATDPSYYSQIVVMTASMQGNYGAHNEFWESKKVWIQGFVCLQIQNTKRESSWVDKLTENQVPILTDVDTRKLVLKLRSAGTPWGALVQAADIVDAKAQAAVLITKQKQIDTDWVNYCSRKEIEDFKGQNPKGPKVALIDLGCKENILRELLKRCSAVRIFPSRVESSVIKDWAPNSILLSNGPGDPAAVLKTPETIKDFIGKIPIFGICMGHQVLALSMGAKTYKLKFGHRGANHPIQDLLLNKIYMSSQNHGYAVDETTLPRSIKVTHKNLNDNTVAGFYSEELNCLGIQYHPESHPGPHEAEGLFDFFIEQMHKSGAKVKNGIIENEL